MLLLTITLKWCRRLQSTSQRVVLCNNMQGRDFSRVNYRPVTGLENKETETKGIEGKIFITFK